MTWMNIIDTISININISISINIIFTTIAITITIIAMTIDRLRRQRFRVTFFLAARVGYTAHLMVMPFVSKA